MISASVPAHLRDQVSAYVRSASHLSVDPNRVLLCAGLLVAAQRRPECHLPPGPTVSMTPHDTLAALMGHSDGMWHSDAPRAVVASHYRRFRQAGQQINRAARAERQRMKKLLEVLEKHDEVLPETLRLLAENIRKQANALEPLTIQLLTATHLRPGEENPLHWRRLKDVQERFNVPQQALIWWRYGLHQGRTPRGKIWGDIYALARIWRLTDCQDVDHLKRGVVRLTKGVTGIAALPAWCLKACQLEV